MCTVSAGNIIMENETIMDLMANSNLDLIHKQVLMTLYAFEAQKRLSDFRAILPVYLSMSWENCAEILKVLESEGLITLGQDTVIMNYPLNIEAADSSCGCMS